MRHARWLAVSLVAIGTSFVLAQPAGAAEGTSVTPTQIGSVQAAEETSTYEVGRDDGLSVALATGNDFWLFGDTSIHTDPGGSWNLSGFIEGGTAAEGSVKAGADPNGLGEVTLNAKWAPGNMPSQFMPTPTDVRNPDGGGGLCTPGAAAGTNSNGDSQVIAYPADWPTGTTLLGSKVLVTYQEVCVMHLVSGGSDVGTATQSEGYGFLELDSKTDKITVGPDDVFAPATNGAQLSAEYTFGSPIIEKGNLYLFSSECIPGWTDGVCLTGDIWLTTLADTTGALKNAKKYAPTLDAAPAGTNWNPGGTTFNYYPGTGYVLVEMTSVGGTFDTYTAAKATGPWTAESNGTLPGCDPNSVGICYAFVGHPELSNSKMEMTYYLPGYGPDPSAGHLVAATIPMPG